MKGARVQTVVRVPVSAIVEELVEAHSIQLPIASVVLEGDCLVIAFGSGSDTQTDESPQPRDAGNLIKRGDGVSIDASKVREGSTLGSSRTRVRRGRRRSGSRNRMKTRGWNVVAKIQNSHGQTVAVYEPFVAALKGPKQPRRAMERIVEGILRSNGNDPKQTSIDYFLDNTLEFISSESSKQPPVESRGTEG